MIKKFIGARIILTTEILVLMVAFISCNMANRLLLQNFRLDCTTNSAYTLSKGSIQIIADIKEPIILRFYFSKNLIRNYPALYGYVNRLQELLVQYQKHSKGKIVLLKTNVEPFSDAEDEALHYGLKGAPVDDDGTELFLGLVANNSVGIQEKIPFFQPNREALLEYDLSQIMYQLNRGEKPVVGVISSLLMSGQEGVYGYGSQPWAIWEQLQQMFELRSLSQDEATIADDIKLLLLVNPTDLTAKAARAIDGFVMRGGHIMAFIDPVADLAEGMQNKNPEVAKLLASWGVNVSTNVVASREFSRQVRYAVGAREYIARYPLWLEIPEQHFSKNDLITSNLSTITFATPGEITVLPNATTRVSPLISSGADSMFVEPDKINGYKEDPRTLLQEFAPDGKDKWLAVRITGKINSIANAGEEESIVDPKLLATNKRSKFVNNANIVLVADADFLHDNFWVQIQNFMGYKVLLPQASNGHFVQSALEHLSGSNALINIRNRGVFSRPFTKLQSMQINSELALKQKETQLLAVIEAAKTNLSKVDKNTKNATLFNASKMKEAEEKFRAKLIASRKELRAVRHTLSKDLVNMQLLMRFLGMGIMPLCIIIFGSLVWFYKLKFVRLPKELQNLLFIHNRYHK